MNDKVQIERAAFNKACEKHLDKTYKQLVMSDIENCASAFGIKIHLYFRNYLLCIVTDHEKLFLNRLKYGF